MNPIMESNVAENPVINADITTPPSPNNSDYLQNQAEHKTEAKKNHAVKKKILHKFKPRWSLANQCL